MTRGGRQSRKRGRLSRSGEFVRARRDGRSEANRYLVVYAFSRDRAEGGEMRLGISVGRKIGGAVERNRVKRALRECFWELAARLPARYDFVVVARSDARGLLEREGPAGLRSALEDLLAVVATRGRA